MPRHTSLHELFGDIAPKLADLTEDVVFGDIWQRPQLPPRERSLITVAALLVQSRPDQLKFHLNHALANGLAPEELAEAICFILSDAASYISGVALPVDGGKAAQLYMPYSYQG